MERFIYFIILLAILLSGIPVAFGLGFLGLAGLYFFMGTDLGLMQLPQKGYDALDSFILVALPLYILAARAILGTAMGARIFNMAKVWFGKRSSGLGIGTIFACGVDASMTGSSFVTATTMGLITMPELKKAGYKPSLTSGIIAAGGSLGGLIPPSIGLILYAALTDESTGKLFMAGVVPGILSAAIFVAYLSCIKGGAVPDRQYSIREKLQVTGNTLWGLMVPVIILGGIYTGIFTPTEAAAVAAVYILVIGFVAYRTLSIKSFWEILMQTARTNSMIAMILVGGKILAHIITFMKIPHQLMSYLLEVNLSSWAALAVIIVFLLILGMFMEVISLIIITVPILYPLVLHYGWDNVWFGIIIMCCVNIALITPPVGGTLFIISQIGQIRFEQVLKGVFPFVLLMILVLILIAMFPILATWLPGLMSGN